MVDDFAYSIENSSMFSEIDSNLIITEEYSNSKYPHITFKVEDIFDFLKIINLLSDTVRNFSFVNGEMLYRGMANEDWDLKPTLGRIKNNELLEYNLVNSFLNFSPSEFLNLSTSFELLSKMQHYGLPTRLLDFTANPLIALFFACCDEKNANKNARIICHSNFVKISQDKIIEAMCGMYKYSFIDDMYLEDLKISPYEYLMKMYRYDNDRLMVARPAYWNKRIQNQQAVFMIFPNRLFDYYAFWAYGGEKEYPYVWGKEEKRKILSIVKNEPIEEIYENKGKLDFHINHNSITKLFKYYKENDYSKLTNWEEPFKGRFRFKYALDLIDDYTIENEFCSIIVDKNNKKKMLAQLKQIGIDKAFVYPELQYVAEKVKDMYINE